MLLLLSQAVFNKYFYNSHLLYGLPFYICRLRLFPVVLGFVIDIVAF